ncbi:hypothetical protein JCM10213_006038 [Rhodosporidiobolus nylandii]
MIIGVVYRFVYLGARYSPVLQVTSILRFLWLLQTGWRDLLSARAIVCYMRSSNGVGVPDGFGAVGNRLFFFVLVMVAVPSFAKNFITELVIASLSLLALGCLYLSSSESRSERWSSTGSGANSSFLLPFFLAPFLVLQPLIVFPFGYNLFQTSCALRAASRSRRRFSGTPITLHVAVNRLLQAIDRYEDILDEHYQPRVQAQDTQHPQAFLDAAYAAACAWSRLTWPQVARTYGTAPPLLLVRHGAPSSRTSFRLALHTLLSNQRTFAFSDGSTFTLTPSECDLFLSHLRHSFSPFSQYPPHADLQRKNAFNAGYFGLLTQLSCAASNRILLLLAAFLPFLSSDIHFAFPSLAYDTRNDLLSDPAVFTQHCLGLGHPPFNPDRIAPLSELYANNDFRSFFSAIRALHAAAQNDGVDPDDCLEAFKAAYVEACRDPALEKQDEQIEERVLDAVIAWKAVKLERASGAETAVDAVKAKEE